MSIGSPLTPLDLARFEAIGITRQVLEQAQVRRVAHHEAREQCGIRYKTDHLEGIAFAYVDPVSGRVCTYRVRRDSPELDTDGTPIGKYLSPPDRKHLYFAPEADTLLADVQAPVVIVEAEKSALAIHAAERRTGCAPALVIATGGCWGHRCRIGTKPNAHGVHVPVKGFSPDLDRVRWAGRDVIICFDSNAATNENVQAGRRSLAGELQTRGAQVRIAELPEAPGVNGPDDYLGRHGAAALFALFTAATPFASKPTAKAGEKQGRAVQFEAIEPWPTPVDGAALLDAIATTVRRHFVVPAHADTIIALWTVHAYTLEASFTSPFLAITSPEKRCGKTLLLILIGAVTPRRMFAANISPAALFRTIEKYGPTLLIDEADCFLRDDDELRGLLNSGHTRTTAICVRVAGDDHEPRLFSTWCPKVIALIGQLPGTLADRSIEIKMKRRTRTDPAVERLRQDRIDRACAMLRRQAVRWAADHLATLAEADPAVPEALHDRAADCFRPLLAIADAAGGSWPTLAREAAEAVSRTDADDTLPTTLLSDCRVVFTAKGNPECLATQTLREKLVELEDRPWKEFHPKTGKPITGQKLAALLKPYGILPTDPVRIKGQSKPARAYLYSAFADAWARYHAGQRPLPGGRTVTP